MSEAWDDINPPVTALARQSEPRLPCSALAPATNEHFRNELAACLTLVAPVGMTEEARRDWFAVAWKTVGHLPPDLLSMGCDAARKSCDHPAKIVPAIIAATDAWMESRRHMARPVEREALPPPTKKHVMDRRGQAMSEADTAELNGILETLGADARYRPDGTRFFMCPEAEERAKAIEEHGYDGYLAWRKARNGGS